MKFEIRRAKNGVILNVHMTADEAGEEVVYQEIEDDEVEGFAAFLWFLVEQYGPSTSRYSPKRVHVVVEPGDKYEGGDEEAEAPPQGAPPTRSARARPGRKRR